MMATLRRFMALLLVVQGGCAISPENRDPLFRIALHNLELAGALSPQKGSPAKRTGHTLRVAAQYIQKTPKNNGLFGAWLVDFGRSAGLNCPFRGRDRPRAGLRRSGISRLR